MSKWLNWVPTSRRVMTKKVCLNKQQSMLLDKFLANKENHAIFDFKSHVEIAAIAAGNLKFPISPSTITMTWRAMVMNNDEVWAAPHRKRNLSVRDEMESMKEESQEHRMEQDRKFKKIIEILDTLSTAAVRQESFQFNNGGGNGTELSI